MKNTKTEAKPLALATTLLLVTCMVCISPASAQEQYRINLMVAYDEEFSYTAQYFYGYSPQTLAYIFLTEAESAFNQLFSVRFIPVTYRSWDSDDSVTDKDIMMNESIAETGFISGQLIYNTRVDILVVFSDQPTIGVYGYSDQRLGVALVMETWLSGAGGGIPATDNILKHELSHLYGATEEWIPDHMCLMNYYPYYLPFPYDYYVPTVLVSDTWCSTQIDYIISNADRWGTLHYTIGGCFMGVLWWCKKAMVAW